MSAYYQQANNGQIKSVDITFGGRRVAVLLPTMSLLTPHLYEFKGAFYTATVDLVNAIFISRLHTLDLCFNKVTEVSATLIPQILSSQTLQKLTLKGVFVNMSGVHIGLPTHGIKVVKLVNCTALNQFHWQSFGRHLAGIDSLTIAGTDVNSVHAIRPLILDSKSLYLKEYRVCIRYTGNEKVCEVIPSDTTGITIQASVKQPLRIIKEYIRLMCIDQVKQCVIEGQGIVFGVEAAKLFDRQHSRLSMLRSCRFVGANVSGALKSITKHLSKISGLSEFYISDKTLGDKDIKCLIAILSPQITDFGIGDCSFKNKKNMMRLASAMSHVSTVRLRVTDETRGILAKLKESTQIKQLDLSGSAFPRGIESLPLSIPLHLRRLSLKNCELTPTDMGNLKKITQADVLINVTGNMLNGSSTPRSSHKFVGLDKQNELTSVRKTEKSKAEKKAEEKKTSKKRS